MSKGKSTSKPIALAVLTGDLVRYTEWTEKKRALAFQALIQATSEIVSWPGAQGSSHLERIRGDGWQFALTVPALALRAALKYRAALRGAEAKFGTPKRELPELDSRISIGFGPKAPFDPNYLAGCDGDAFIESGRGLDAMKKEPGIVQASVGLVMREIVFEQALVRICDEISRNWTDRQAAVMALALNPTSESGEQRAEQLGIKRQTFEAHLAASQARAIFFALDAFEAPIEEMQPI